MEKLEFYKEKYYKEFERRNRLEDSLNFPFGIVSALSAIWFYYISNFQFGIDGYNRILFISLMSASIVLILISIVNLLNSYHTLSKRYQWGYLPDADTVEKYSKDLEEWHTKNSSSVDEAKKEFEDYLITKFNEASSLDSYQNKRKSAYLHWGKTFLYYSVSALLLASISYAYKSYEKKEKVNTKIEMKCYH